jgi:hypothetical protein
MAGPSTRGATSRRPDEHADVKNQSPGGADGNAFLIATG